MSLARRSTMLRFSPLVRGRWYQNSFDSVVARQFLSCAVARNTTVEALVHRQQESTATSLPFWPTGGQLPQYRLYHSTCPLKNKEYQKPKRKHPQSSGRLSATQERGVNKSKGRNLPQSSGRLVVAQTKGVKKSKDSNKPKLCVGCGVEVIHGSHGEILGNDQADEMTKHAKRKQARYADIREKTGFLCQRCKALNNVDGSSGFNGARDALADVPPSVFMDQLKQIVNRRKFGFAIKVIDATDVEGTVVRGIRNAIGSLPIILVVNKVDLLPVKVEQFHLHEWKRRLLKSGINVKEVIAVSANNGDGMIALAEAVLSGLGGRDAFVIGAANVGKSTLVKSLSRIVGQVSRMKFKSRRDAVRNLDVTVSHLPGTTLQAIRIPCFSSPKHALWDTPGIINDGALTYHIFPSRVMEPLALPTPIKPGSRTMVAPGESILMRSSWLKEEDGGTKGTILGRIDVLECEEKIYFAPFCKEPIDVEVVKTASVKQEARVFLGADEDDMAVPLTKFQDVDHLDHSLDVSFTSLGWITFHSFGRYLLRPWTLKGSRWSKRSHTFYPTNFTQRMEEGSYKPYEEPVVRTDELDKETFRRLRNAQNDGRHGQKYGKYEDESDFNFFDDMAEYDDYY